MLVEDAEAHGGADGNREGPVQVTFSFRTRTSLVLAEKFTSCGKRADGGSLQRNYAATPALGAPSPRAQDASRRPSTNRKAIDASPCTAPRCPGRGHAAGARRPRSTHLCRRRRRRR